MSAVRGAEAVAKITTLPLHEALVIGALRARCDGAAAHGTFVDELAGLMGPATAERIEAALDGFFDLVLRHGRRPVLRHSASCACVGADEAVLAHLVSIATGGDSEDAMLMACLLVRADMAPAVVSQARLLGLELQRGAPDHPHPPAAPGRAVTLH
ncbi:hypothetical protein [Pseudooceanicola marinus]|uniref:hypothetical protein n=1 Tax=Pseudooceanicola marinus TaxID=396013 RepID=UPI001CD7484F|nr:hypothetical protein [Pseudooceanicola marinus]MCA1335216.1 hypothetical protein [Pseudooceanicola marinus]